MANLMPVEVLEDWLVSEGYFEERVGLKDYEVAIESEYMRSVLCVRRYRHHLMNPTGPSFQLEILFDEETLFSILATAVSRKK